MKQCPYCPCVFETQADLEAHMRAFGNDKQVHLIRFKAHTHSNRDYEP